MFWNLRHTETKRSTNDADCVNLLSRWEIAVTQDGLLIRPIGPELTPQDLAPLTRRLTQCDSTGAAQRVRFDFSTVRHFGPQWTVVLAMLLDLSRRLNGAVSVSGLQGQPAAVMSLYRNNQSLRRLIAA